MSRISAVGLALIGACAAALPTEAFATEGGGSFYLPGIKGPGAALTPPPGLFVTNDFYFYEGSAGKNVDLPFGGDLLVGADLQLIADVPSAVWITKAEILGGRLGFGVSIPIVNGDINAFLDPGPFKFEDNLTVFADPIVSALIGWDSGNFHWQTGAMINVPIGQYDDDETFNLSRHYWGANLYGAFTWLDPSIGLDLSSTIGFTFNGENPATDYQSGTEFHWEWAAVQHFNEKFSAGFVGYYYQQITGDSGSGASLGDFEGRVAAVGLMAGYNFQVGIVPIQTNIRYYHEFAAKNRFEGDAVFFSASMPLWVPH